MNTFKIKAEENSNINQTIEKVYAEYKKNISYQSAEIMLAGTYFLKEPIKFKDNCTFPITISGVNNTVIDGGWHIKSLKETVVNGVKAWSAKIDCEKAQYLRFDQLFVNEERRYRPTYPSNRFWGATGIKIEGDIISEASLDFKERDWQKGTNKILLKEDLPEFSNIEDITIMLNHCWLHERMPIKSIDYENRIITTESISRFTVFPDEIIYLENVFEELKNHGEWYYDKKNLILYYIPLDGEDINTADIVIPFIDEFINIKNTSNKHISNIKFKYASSRYEYSEIVPYLSPVIPTETQMQAECEVPGCIQFLNAKHCSITDCNIEHIGRYAIEVGEGCTGLTIANNTFFDIGCGAVKIGGSKWGEDTNKNACYINISDNHIHHYGMMYQSAVAVLLTHCHHCNISHNDIHDGDYSAISCGWVWGYDSNISSHNVIEYNHIHHIGRNNLCDMGGIYILGTQPCTVIRNNLIHDITDREKNGWGIYLDEGSTHVLVENNIIYNTSTEAMHLHYGKNNIITNNIFALCNIALLSNTRYEPHLQMTVERNIFYSNNGNIIRIKRGEGAIAMDKNIYYSTTGQIGFCTNNYEENMIYHSFDEWKKTGNDFYSKNCHPLFMDVSNYDFSLTENSPAYEIGYKDISLADVGIRKKVR